MDNMIIQICRKAADGVRRRGGSTTRHPRHPPQDDPEKLFQAIGAKIAAESKSAVVGWSR